MAGSSDEQTAMWQRVIQIPTRALFKRYLKATNTDKGRATQVLHEYKRLLTLKALDLDVDGTRIASSPALTGMWQQHVLDTAAYAACCTALCGSVLNHKPEAQDDANHSVSCHRALQLYRRHFGEDPPVHTWDFGDIGPPPSQAVLLAEDVDAPAAKRARAAAQSNAIHVSVQAPALPLCPITARGSDSVLALFKAFIASSGASHLVAGHSAVPPTTRLRCNGRWLSNDAQTLADAGVAEGDIVFVATPRERNSREELSVSVREVGGGNEQATVFVRPEDTSAAVMRQVQDALGIAADSQQLIFASNVLRPTDTMAAKRVGDGCTLQLVVGKRPGAPATRQAMSPGGTWR